MTSLFGGDSNSDKYMKRQGQFIGGATQRANRLIDSSKATNWLTKASKNLKNSNLGNTSGKSPAFSFFTRNGKVGLNRTGEAQGYMDSLLQGRNQTDRSYGNLLSRLGFGQGGAFSQLASERDKQLQLAKQKAVGDLRSQLARRRVQGASFAEDQVKGVEAEYDRQRDLALAESVVQDLQMTKEVINERTTAWISSLQQSLQHLQFEGSAALKLQEGMQQGLTNLASLQTGLAELGAKLTLEGQMAKAGISANLSGIQAGSYPGYAELQSQEDAGTGQMIGSLVGGGLGLMAGSSVGAPLQGAMAGASLGGGGGLPSGFFGSGGFSGGSGTTPFK